MPQLSPAGNEIVQRLGQRHGLSTDAVTHMLIAIHNGNGSMAQFNHPEFGGCGQWMRGGMTMVSDLFNYQLKSRVENICNDIANELANHQTSPFQGSFQSQSQGGQSQGSGNTQSQASGAMGSNNSLFVPDPDQNWWPEELGVPNATGAQNNIRYAYFSWSRRLAVKTGSDVWVYDTLDHQIGGFGQQQGGGSSITFTSQYGTVNLASLPVVSRNGVAPVPPTPAPAAPAAASPASETASNNMAALSPSDNGNRQEASGNDGILGTLERLGALKEKGYISDQEFEEKKRDLLSRL
ncbi:SHOCT domain-containing protein [Novipirellula rosea]|uniref:SHOCT domain-containing protein n=1 Tax=Novipirellula rosea TaxID=1031540 RepID=A0ABP8MZP2_9BACT